MYILDIVGQDSDFFWLIFIMCGMAVARLFPYMMLVISAILIIYAITSLKEREKAKYIMFLGIVTPLLLVAALTYLNDEMMPNAFKFLLEVWWSFDLF